MKVGIIGGAGYTGGELMRLLIHHPFVDLISVVSESQSGKSITTIHTDLRGDTDLVFSKELSHEVELIFLCKGHGESTKHISANPALLNKKIIDLSTDFRPRKNKYGFVYGLPELNKSIIKTATHIANPGCFATAIQLGLLPLAEGDKIESDIHIHAITGATGAGQKPRSTTHFSWRSNNISIYKLFEHQHLAEITETMRATQKAFDQKIHFVPIRGDLSRGIFASIYTETNLSIDQVLNLYQTYYKDHPFVTITTDDISLKEIVNTNKCFLQIQKRENMIHITSVIDNLLKGASGQAIHNMNLMKGWDENTGLKLKSVAF